MRGIYKVREWEADDHDDRRDAETVPAPPRSDIRMLGGRRREASEDPLALYVEALSEPAIEVEPRTLPPPSPRVPRQTAVMPMRPQQATLVMIDRPVRSSALARPSTPMSTPPRPFRGFMPVLILAFASGLVVAALIAIAFIRL